MGFVNSAWERYIESAERAYRGMEEGVKRMLIELETSAKKMTTTGEREKDPWLAQLDWTLKKARKSRGVAQEPDEPEHEHDTLRGSSVAQYSRYFPRIVPLLLKLRIMDFHSTSRNKAGITSTVKEKWANFVPLVVRREGSKDLEDRIHELAAREMVLGLDETQKRFTFRYDRSHPSKPNCTAPAQVGVERLSFVSFERTRLDMPRSFFRL